MSRNFEQGKICLRGLRAAQRKYDNQAQVQTQSITQPAGSVLFLAQQDVSSLCSITHLISFDGVHFQAITPGSVVALASSPFWYRATLQRQTNVAEASGPLAAPQDPTQSANYTLSSTTTQDLGGGVVQRTIVCSAVSGPITLLDTPLPGTFSVWQGAAMLRPTAYTETKQKKC